MKVWILKRYINKIILHMLKNLYGFILDIFIEFFVCFSAFLSSLDFSLVNTYEVIFSIKIEFIYIQLQLNI